MIAEDRLAELRTIESKFNHLGVAVPDLQQAGEGFERLFGYKLIRGPYADPIQKVLVCFIGKPDTDLVIELVAPGGENSPISNYLKKSIGGYHACYEVPDLECAVRTAQSQGCLMIGEPVPAIAFDNRRICWLFTPMRLLIELVEQ
jgi:methylmalonyl-CoA/ethylmalonyl-CoA epimerase